MPDGVRTHPPIKSAIELRARNLVEGGEKVLHRHGGSRPSFSGNSIQLAAIACGENNGFFQDAALAQFIGSIQRLLWREYHTLAQFERRGAMVASNQRHMDAHCARSC